MKCGKSTIIIAAMSVILIPASVLFAVNPPPQDAFELQLHLIFVCHGDGFEGTYQLSFGWSATDAVDSGSTLELQWRSETALAVGVTADPIHQAIESAFSEIRIGNDYIQVTPSGGWTLDVPGRVNDYVTLGVRATGLNDTLLDVVPYGEVSLVPWSLRTALAGYGVETVNVKARVGLRISADLLTHFVNSVGIVVRFYADLIRETIVFLLGSFSTLN